MSRSLVDDHGLDSCILRDSRPCRNVYNPAPMTEDERAHLLSTVGQAHAGLSEVALTLRLGLPPKTPALKTAIKAERTAFDLKRSLQRLEVKDVETT